MKLKYGLGAVIAATAIATSCAEDDTLISEENTSSEDNATHSQSRANITGLKTYNKIDK